jgi:hypothetical protein
VFPEVLPNEIFMFASFLQNIARAFISGRRYPMIGDIIGKAFSALLDVSDVDRGIGPCFL